VPVTFNCNPSFELEQVGLGVVQANGNRLTRAGGAWHGACTGRRRTVLITAAATPYSLKPGKATATADVVIFDVCSECEFVAAHAGPQPIRLHN